MDGDDLPYDVILSLQRILDLNSVAESDPLDKLTQFSPVDVLNTLFPDEASLAQIEATQARLAENEQDLQREIDMLTAQLRRDQDPSRMHMIQEMISDLLGQMSRIREKATESEAIVRNITKEIQVLDLAKKNLILSMTTLKRLQMLVNALSQLEDLIQDKKYADISQTLSAVKQISASFKPYTSVEHIAQVWKRVQEIQGEIRAKVETDFDAFFLQDPSKPIKLSLITDACHVVDVLGAEVRAQLIDRYVSLELKEYRRIFRPTDEAGQLDNITRRFAWFRRLLQTHDTEQGRAFPDEWKVGWHLCAKFVDITRDDMANLLTRASSGLTVTLLLDVFQHTKDFEASMARKYTTTLADILKYVSATSSQPIKPISASFEPHMGVFVDAQDKALADMLAPHRGVRSRPSHETSQLVSDETAPAAIVLPSSTELFYFYSQSLEQCAKLSTGQALFDLCALHKKWLRIYAEDVLVASMKRPVLHTRRSIDARFDISELRNACLLINTSDYCQTTALELEEKIQQQIKKEFREKVTLQPERDLFVGVISAAIMVQLRELESACDQAFSVMTRTQWTNLDHVSGQSPYIGDLVKAIDQVIDIIRPLVEQKKYLRNMFDKAASLLIAKFTNALVKSRPLKDIGAEQLLIDLQGLKACLLKIPGESSTTSTYARGVARSTTHLETLLKVIVTPVDPAEGFILNYTLLVGDASFSNFQKVLDLKGTPRVEQNSLLDSFLTITSTKDELESTSFLSSLDMDPSPNSQVSNITSPGGSRVSLPTLLASTASGTASPGESIFATLGSPPPSGPPTGSETPLSRADPTQKREVFSDLRRFVNFAVRRDSAQPS